ncbi:MAG TPA: VOC family protein [Acidimicrobiales bacterium]|nr:VOC family protein [Acidimicrobiales bacterium]
MATIKRVAPVFPVRDLEVALAHYRRLGFEPRTYRGGAYGFVSRDGIELHVGVVPHVDNTGAKHTIYLFVDDADALAEQWSAAGVEVRMPVDTDWHQHEGSVVDPDGNVIRFGSPVSQPDR